MKINKTPRKVIQFLLVLMIENVQGAKNIYECYSTVTISSISCREM